MFGLYLLLLLLLHFLEIRFEGICFLFFLIIILIILVALLTIFIFFHCDELFLLLFQYLLLIASFILLFGLTDPIFHLLADFLFSLLNGLALLHSELFSLVRCNGSCIFGSCLHRLRGGLDFIRIIRIDRGVHVCMGNDLELRFSSFGFLVRPI